MRNKKPKASRLSKLRKIIETSSIDILFFIPICIGFLLLIGLLSVSIFVEIQDWFRDLTINTTIFVWGCGGVVIIIKKESPSPSWGNGGMAILQGVIFIISTGGFNILYLVSLFR